VTKKIHCPQGYRAIKAIMPSRLSCHKGYRIFHVTLTRVEKTSIRSKHQTNDASKVKGDPPKKSSQFPVETQETFDDTHNDDISFQLMQRSTECHKNDIYCLLKDRRINKRASTQILPFKNQKKNKEIQKPNYK
jgi:hypothetical protein